MTLDDILDFPYDPWILLGVTRETDDKAVEAAWKRARSPESGILSEAYEMLRDEPSRLRTILLNPRPYSRATDAESAMKKHPVYVGPGAWYEAIARRSRP